MGKPIAVQGCTVTTNGLPNLANIVTPPSTNVMCDNKGAYAGTINVMVSGYSDPAISGGMGQGTISGTSTSTQIDNQPAVLVGDQGTATLSGANPSSGSPVSGYVVTLVIADAGQTNVLAD